MEIFKEKIEEAKKQICQFNKKAGETGQNTGTWGNMSIRIKGSDLFVITPSGMDPEKTGTEHIVLMNLDGDILRKEGDPIVKPSSEYRLHIAIYKAREDVLSIVHTHAVYCTALAIARKGIPAACEDLIQIVGGDVRVSEYVLPGTEQLGINVVKALEGRDAVIMANHGLVAVGKSISESYKCALVCEKSAQATLLAMPFGIHELDEEECRIMREFYTHSYGQK